MAILPWLFFGTYAGSQLFNIGQNIANTDYNALMTRRQFRYQKKLQMASWVREDRAVRRRVADLKAAGLSPVLAAGSPAQTMSPIKPEAPHREPYGKLQMAGELMGLQKMAEEIKNLNAQRENIQTNTLYTRLKGAVEQWNMWWYKNQNLPTTASPMMKTVAGFMANLEKTLDDMAGGRKKKDYPGPPPVPDNPGPLYRLLDKTLGAFGFQSGRGQ